LDCARDTSIVNKDVQVFLSRFDFFHQTLNLLLLGDIRSNVGELPRDALLVSFNRSLKLFFSATNKVDLSTITGEDQRWPARWAVATYTAKACAAMRPIPLPPPVTRATLF
jgi:hypothetical protein